MMVAHNQFILVNSMIVPFVSVAIVEANIFCLFLTARLLTVT